MSKKITKPPPRVPLLVLKWFCDPRLLEDVEGDVRELYVINLEKKKNAQLLMYLDVLKLLRPGIVRMPELGQNSNHSAMIRNYLLTAFRNSMRYKGYTSLNILGLVVGIASSMLMLMWVYDEATIDKYHTHGDQIYQLYRVMRQSNGSATTTESLPKPLADHVRATYPEVSQVGSLSWEMETEFNIADKVMKSEGRFASQSYLDMFTFTWLAGDRTTALQDMSGLVINKSMAMGLFGEHWKSSIGQVVRVDDDYDLKITGVFDDIGPNASLSFGWLAPAELYFSQNEWVDDWGNGSFGAFMIIPDASKVEQVRERIFNEINVHAADNPNAGDEVVIFQKFKDAYLYSKFENGVIVGGRIDYVMLLSIVAILTLLIACINFMNLATARASRRSREVGIRKAIGAQRSAVSAQFYVESALVSAVAVVLSILLVILVLPVFNILVNKELVLDFTSSISWIFILTIFGFVSVFSGSYPAILLSRFSIVGALKGTAKPNSMTSYVRKGLVIFQFAISTILIIGTLVIYQQIDFALTKDLGLDKHNMLAVRLAGNLSDQSRLQTYKTELLRIPEVKAVTAASGNPVYYGRSTSSTTWEGKSQSEGYEINVILSDEQFIDVMGMEVLKGRPFSSQLQDSTNFLINEVAADLMGFEEPINKDLSFWGIEGKIVGVVKNFHMRDFYTPIAPLIITCIPSNNLQVVLIRMEGEVPNAIASIEKLTQSMVPGEEFEYEFLDQTYASAYDNERIIGTLASAFAGISILISCLGLFGLASFSTERRAKEIGVRKVHGASSWQILMLLSGDYSRLIILAFVLAIPFAYYIADDWLANFEYRMVLTPSIFILAGISTFVVGVLTVAFKSYQAARTNPAATLKDE